MDGISLLTLAFVSVPALLAGRAAAVEAASAGQERLDVGILAVGGVGMGLIGLLAILVGVYDRRIGRRYRMGSYGALTPLLGVLVQLTVGMLALSVVYAFAPGAV